MKIGDKVKIIKKFDSIPDITWAEEMDKTVSMIGTICYISDYNYNSYVAKYMVDIGKERWYYLKESLKLINQNTFLINQYTII